MNPELSAVVATLQSQLRELRSHHADTRRELAEMKAEMEAELAELKREINS